MLLSLLVLAQVTAAVPGAAPADVTAAKSWVDLVDAKRWNDSWSAAGALFKSRMPEPRWASTVEPVREPLGAVASRSLKSVTSTRSLPGAPDGDYEVLQFDTRFANKAAATETVILCREGGGWKVGGYFIR